MRKRTLYWLSWVFLAALLYFFENNTGTRIVLACSVLLPAVPEIRRALTGTDEREKRFLPAEQTIRVLNRREAEEPGDVRAYLPGDPVNRIHWKLSAKKDELLYREPARETAAEEETVPAAREAAVRIRTGERILWTGTILLILVSLALLFGLASGRSSAGALANRLFDASEAVNDYVYVRFPEMAGSPVMPAAVLLTAVLLALAALAAFSRQRGPALCLIGGCAVFQAYFGLAFPGWVNVGLFTLFGLKTLRKPRGRREAAALMACIAAVALLTALVFPGVDVWTENASEAARDRLSRLAQQLGGAVPEGTEGEKETRHTHTQSLTEGEEEARTGREYRLVTVDEEQISRPHWINYLKIILLLLLTAALVILPFLPFLILNARRRKALRVREAFLSEDIGEAVCAIFQQTVAWLEAMDRDAGNVPYDQWEPALAERMTPEYAAGFGRCAAVFGEAAYSAHPMKEEQRQQMLELLAQTEGLLKAEAGWKKKIRLKYWECLWI